MPEPVFFESHHEGTGRFAVLEEDGGVAYFYLLRPDQSIEKAVLAYMRVHPVDSTDWDAFAKRGEPPPLTRDLATPSAVIDDALAENFRIEWSGDGSAAAVLHRGVPIAWTSAAPEHGYGYSKGVSKDSAFAKSWDEAAYKSVFGI